jgi:hypothetical protein
MISDERETVRWKGCWNSEGMARNITPREDVKLGASPPKIMSKNGAVILSFQGTPTMISLHFGDT